MAGIYLQPEFTVANIVNLSSPPTVCEGESVSLTANNTTQLQGNLSFVWTGPNGFAFQGTAPAQGPFPLDLTNLNSTFWLAITN